MKHGSIANYRSNS